LNGVQIEAPRPIENRKSKIENPASL